MKTLHIFGLGLLAVAVTAIAFTASSANAADIYRRDHHSMKDAPSAYMPPIVWAGFYMGGHAGVGWAGDDRDYLDNNEQALGGLHLGYNWQSPQKIVLGIEGDADIAKEFSYLASVRARLGVSYARALFYVTGGVAFADFKNKHFDTTTGWVAGVGVDKMVSDQFSVGLEGLYYGFEEAKYDNTDDSADVWAVRARLSYHFGADAIPLK
ncbi:MAG: outer membrane beta-barrel protein [Alphaproteobacteria bacterium]